MRPTLVYLFLVGLPALGVAVVLEGGQGVTSPISLGGAWEVELLPDSVCGRQQNLDTLFLSVEQSGQSLKMRLGTDGILFGLVSDSAFEVKGESLGVRGRVRLRSARYQFEGVVSGVPCARGVRRAIATRLGRASRPAGR